MGKSAAGPDIQDCLRYLRQMDDQSGLFTTILLLPGGSKSSPHVTISILSVHKQAEVGKGKGVATMYSGYPSNDHTTFEGAFYRAIIEHDKHLSADVWDQTVGF